MKNKKKTFEIVILDYSTAQVKRIVKTLEKEKDEDWNDAVEMHLTEIGHNLGEINYMYNPVQKPLDYIGLEKV